DFRVEEVPAYLPCGEGEHLFLWVEKRALSTPQVAAALAAELGLSEREVSYAGLKDRQAGARPGVLVAGRARGGCTGLGHAADPRSSVPKAPQQASQRATDRQSIPDPDPRSFGGWRWARGAGPAAPAWAGQLLWASALRARAAERRDRPSAVDRR